MLHKKSNKFLFVFNHRFHLIVFIVIIALLTLNIFFAKEAIAAPYTLPYPGYMPGNPLYKVSNIIDVVQKWWSFGNFAKFSYHISLADKKLVEAKTLFEYEQYLLGYQALETSDKNFREASVFLLAAEHEGKNISQKKTLFQNAVEKHITVLTVLKKALPETFIWKPEKEKPVSLPLQKKIEDSLSLRKEML